MPNLDSIAEFRVLTNNFDAQYGDYSGGIVNVATKSGGNEIHGTAFEFLRNTDLDARNFFSPDRSFYRQNQFGGTVGGPIRKDRIFYFADYQGTRTNQGIDTGLIAIPTLAERTGNFSGVVDELSGRVSGPYLANLLSQKLGYGIATGELYYTPGCVSGNQCVFPNAIVPQIVWSAPAKHLLPYIPLPNSGPATFTTGAFGELTRDDKGSFRVDADRDGWGRFSAYYFIDNYYVNNLRQCTGHSGRCLTAPILWSGFAQLRSGSAAHFRSARTEEPGISTGSLQCIQPHAVLRTSRGERQHR